MANVAPYVAQIRQAVYGEQVRESIALSIEVMNQDNIDTQDHYDNTIAAATEAIDDANDAAAAATGVANTVQEKLDHGDFVGATGEQGPAATVTVGTVTTGSPGSSATVTNTGTSTDAILNFSIPQGATGSVENLDTVTVTFPIDTSYANISSGMTVAALFSRLQLLMDMLLITDTEMTALETTLGIS